MGRAYSMHRKCVHRVFIKDTGRNEASRIPGWETNTKINLEEIGWG